ncbi:uncharacterized protein TNCT_528391 [Trichonephila clavata]|uniref:Uncharacterized protein n=1 Tax=Trichonephila clavata TaxID=2740835 RepID=A0A8X6LML1_TRICU|nr:uncharacterized protein TNCT_528391 [Trichonephila clavata]
MSHPFVLVQIYGVLLNGEERELASIAYDVAVKELEKRQRAQKTDDRVVSENFESTRNDLVKVASLLTQANDARSNFLKIFDHWEPVRRKNIQRLKETSTEIRRDKFNGCVSKIVGGCVGVVGGILLGASFLCPPLAAAAVPLAISGSVISTAGSGVVVGTSGTQIIRLKKKLNRVKTLIEAEEKEFSGLKNWFTFTEVLMNTIEALVGSELIQDMNELRNNFFNEVRMMGCDNVDEYNKKFRSVMEKCVGKMCDSSYIRDKFDSDAAPFVIAFVFVICFMSKRYRGVLDCALLTRRLALEKSTAKNLGLETGQVVTGLALKGSAALGRAVPAIVARVVAVGVFVALGIAVDVLSVVLSSKEIHTGAKSKHADEVSRVVGLLEEEFQFLKYVYKEMKVFDEIKSS